MNRRLSMALVAAGVLALLAAACGGGEATATPQPTRTPLATSVPIFTPAATAPATTAAAATSTPATAATATTIRPIPTPTTAPIIVPTATPAGPQPKFGGVLQTRWYTEFRRPWDTWRQDTGFTYPYVRAMASSLIQYRQGTFDIKADLAERWQVGADGKTFTFFLRKDAQWQDGRPVTSKDILYNFQRGSDPQFAFNRSKVAPIATMETPDDYTFKAVLKDLSNAFLPQVATPSMVMYPSHIPDMAQWQKAPVGSGPFKLVSDKPNTAYEFTRSSNYFLKNAAGRQLPYLDGIVYNVIPDLGLALSAFITGRIDCGCLHSESWVLVNEERIKNEVKGAKLQSHLSALPLLYFNIKRPPFDSADFRKGVSIGLDKDTIGATFRLGKTYRPPPPLVPPEVGGQWGLPKDELQKIPGFNPNHAVDLALGKQKMQQSGLDLSKVRVEIMGPESFKDLSELVASVMKTDLGVQTTVLIAGTAELTDRRARSDFQIYLMTDGGTIDDPADWYRDFLNIGGANNTGGYANPRFDELLLSQDKEPDPAKRKQMVWELQRIELSDYPRVPVTWEFRARVTKPDVMNFGIGPINLQNYDWSDIWLDR